MTIFIRWRRAAKLRLLRARGRACMAAYLRVIDALEYDPFHAEAVCPSLLRYKRRAKACVRLSRRLKAAK